MEPVDHLQGDFGPSGPEIPKSPGARGLQSFFRLLRVKAKGSFQKGPSLEILLEILEIRDPQSVEKQGEPSHFLEKLDLRF